GGIAVPEGSYLGNSTIINPSADAFIIYGSAVEDHSVEHAVYEISNGSGKNHGHGQQQVVAVTAFFYPFTEEVHHPANQKNADDDQKIFAQQSSKMKPVCHARIFHKGEFETGKNIYTFPQVKSGFNVKFGNLID